MPMETVDCCKMEGRAIFAMGSSSLTAKIPADGHAMPRSSPSRTPKDSIAEIPWAISVAQATPVTPMESRVTKYQSSPMLNREENIRNPKGILDFPNALNIEDRILYINRKGRPAK